MKQFNSLFFLLAAFAGLNVYAVESVKPKGPPQIFLISLDTLSARHMSFYGYDRKTTPRLDEFAKDSLAFSKAWSQSAYTMASHMTMFTGLFPYHQNIVNDYKARLPVEIKTLPEILKKEGYKTFFISDLTNQMLSPMLGYGRGIDRFIDLDSFRVGSHDELKNIIRENKMTKNYYFIHTDAVHSPYESEPPYDHLFTSYKSKSGDYKDFKDPSGSRNEKDKRIQWGQEWLKQFDLVNPEHVKILRDLYDNAIANTDARVGEFLKFLKDEGLYDNSIIIITGDHGETFGENNTFFHVYPYISTLHVPLIVHYHGVTPKVFGERVLLADITPTVLKLAGVKQEAKLDGQSLVPASDGKIESHDFGMAVGYSSDTYYDNKWKYVVRHTEEELYDIGNDPGETKNVIKDFPNEAFRLRAELAKLKFSDFKSKLPPATKHAKKLYWFIPDGMRADRGVFDIYRWALQGRLNNVLRMMSEGTWGYSIPDFPSHTPINFASLLTGTHPDVHGISDGPMHVEGQPLNKPSAAGFSSVTKRAPAIWKELFNHGKKIFLLSIPGSTPPEIPQTVVKGRWGNWGSDTPNLVFESDRLFAKRKQLGNAFKLFFLGEPLTRFVPVKQIKKNVTESVLAANGAELPIHVEYKPGNKSFVTMQLGERELKAEVGAWSDWAPVSLKYKESSFDSEVKFSPIVVWKDGTFRIRVLFNGINKFNTEPGEVSTELTDAVGPMLDHLDNWPPQLIFEKEDKRVAMDEVRMSLDWHRKAAAYVIEKIKPDVFIQDTYTPNQMLESRWWHGLIDETRKGYDPQKSWAARSDIVEMYRGLDAIIGEAIAKKDDDTVIVFSSDHGVCPLHRLVHLNNLFAKKGWLKFSVDPKTGEATIDWKNTKVVYLKMLHVYINPDGLGGNWKHGSGPEFEKLRDEVIKTLTELKDTNGEKPLVRAVKWEDAKSIYKLPPDRIGDLVIEAKLNYFWYEEADSSKKIFSTPLTTGYKQSIDPLKNECMWTPFLIWGPGIKKGFFLEKPISHVDQLPTIYRAMDIPIPKHIQGRVLEEAFE
jgi:arylsulfatase A-like enzyme